MHYKPEWVAQTVHIISYIFGFSILYAQVGGGEGSPKVES